MQTWESENLGPSEKRSKQTFGDSVDTSLDELPLTNGARRGRLSGGGLDE